MRKALLLGLATLCLVLGLVPSASAAFGIKELDITFSKDSGGEPATQAGSHPYAMRTFLTTNTVLTPEGEAVDEAVKSLFLDMPEGFIGNQAAVPRCSSLDFLTLRPGGNNVPQCADGTAVGVVTALIGEKGGAVEFKSPVYWVEPVPGSIARIGFWVEGVPVTVDVGLSEQAPYRIRVASTNISQVLEFFGVDVTLWGNPADSSHDAERGECYVKGGTCPAGIDEVPFLTLPRACTGTLSASYKADSWQNPGAFVTGSADVDGVEGCADLGFSPEISSQTTNRQANAATGLDFDLLVDDEGLTDPEGEADSDIKKTEVTLPQGVAINPAQAEGLGACSEADLARESSTSAPGSGCPDNSKVGSVEVETPLLEDETLKGSLYVATPFANPANSLVAVYIVIQDRDLGVSVKLPVKVEPDPQTGQLTATTVGDLPQIPFSRFHLHFREGERSPLSTPSQCGTYTTTAKLTPWAEGIDVYESTSSLEIDSGCPAGPPPFSPGFQAGSTDNTAGAFSPFNLRLTRSDSEQELTRFSSVLPKGLIGKIAGVAKCSDAAIAAAKDKSGLDERANPSCPSGSRVGSVLGGAGVGSSLTYVPGQLYLAGPYNGAPLSVVAIVPAVAGPFDVGTVVTRVALNLNPVTFDVEVDGSKSDPIPHILDGIPLRLRDLRVSVDRSGFMLNPTNCNPQAVQATAFGSFLDFFSSADDSSVGLSARYQAGNCAALAFKPKLSLTFKGGTKRSGHPSLRSVLIPRPGDANIGKAVVILPPTTFIDNAHISNPCTRVQFNADQCPKGSLLGVASATSPLLDEPLTGNVYFRSNGGERQLPDIVADLKGLFRVTLVGKVDSVKGRLRTTFDVVPDAPVGRFDLKLFGGKRGLLVNSANLCNKPRRVTLNLTGQNGRLHNTTPVIKTDCKKKKGKGKKGGRR